MSLPTNVVIDPEPDYRIRIVHPDGHTELLSRNNRNSWKRLSAICHARHFARYHPNSVVHVEQVVAKR